MVGRKGMPMEKSKQKYKAASYARVNHERKRVAAYARVSLGTEHMLHSLAAQVSHYSKYIQSNSEWEYAGIYADADETGTKENRPEFQRLLADCRAGKIDLVLTKALSRFARNTVTLLETVRELKALGIDVYFEEQNIHTLSGEGELLLTLLASYAQEESRSSSENMKWRKRTDMKSGKTKPTKVYGYKVVEDKLEIVPGEAEVVRFIFDHAVDGAGAQTIATELNRRNIPSPAGKIWLAAVINTILRNPKMCGDLLHQRHYIADHISKKKTRNRGELPMYRIEGTHEGIITKETFEAVEAVMSQRKTNADAVPYKYEGLAFRNKIFCGKCGKMFKYKTNSGRHPEWRCWGHERRVNPNCTAQNIPDATLLALTAEVLGLEKPDNDVINQKLERIIASDDRQLTFILHDGGEIKAQWQLKPRGGRVNRAKNNSDSSDKT